MADSGYSNVSLESGTGGVAITPPAPTVAPGGTISFIAAPGAGATGVTITPSAPTVAVGGTIPFTGGF